VHGGERLLIGQAVAEKHKQGQCKRPQRTAKATVSPGNLPVSRIVNHRALLPQARARELAPASPTSAYVTRQLGALFQAERACPDLTRAFGRE